MGSVLWLALAAVDSLSCGVPASQQVAPPRIEAEIRMDGVLDELVWTEAACLSGFTQFSPVDGRPAEEATEVLVWYSPTAIHFGVRATAAPGTVRARLADRDRGIVPDDYIEIQLGTFNDRRQAFVFAANPLGVQADGMLVEDGRGRDESREQADLSPDFTWQAKGRLTDGGYELEIRIPFRSLRYQRADPQDWSLQIIRKSALRGREDTWTPVRREAASFLAQAGTLTGLTGLHRGLVLELNPVVTSSVSGSRPEAAGPWRYRGGVPEPGGNLKWGVTNEVNVNLTVNPDFSQIEADASQISPDPRRALFFQEKRPFFLDGVEYFSAPNQLIYTRRIVAPLVAVKAAGRSGRTTFGLLSAVDDRAFSASGRRPVYNLARLQRDVGGTSRVGLTWTDRIDGGDFNRVGQVDSRFVFGAINSLALTGAIAWTRRDGVLNVAPAWSANFARTGRTFGISATVRGFDPEFEAQSGFLERGGIAQANLSPSVTLYGRPGSLIDRFTASVSADRLWNYPDFATDRVLERKNSFRTNFALRGGLNLGLSLLVERFAYDPRLYQDYAVEVPTAAGVDTVPYNSRPMPSLPNLDLVLNVSTPDVHGFRLNGFIIVGRDDNFFEWNRAHVWFGRMNLGYRPTERLRFDGSLAVISYRRPSDGTIAGDTFIPRLRTEYQVSRAVFVRVVGEYAARRRDDLRDDGRTYAPILIRDPRDGVYRRDLALGFRRNDLRVDWLFSFHPSPGTVFFAGYGSSLVEDRAFRFRDLDRQSDGFFTKLSYLFRI